MRYRVLLFDLFGTLVHFKPMLGPPPGRDGGARSIEWLRGPVQEQLPRVSFDDFLVALLEVSRGIVETRPPEYCEVESHVRFRRTLERLGLRGGRTGEIAAHLCRAHMDHLAGQTEMPPSHGELLRRLAAGYRLGLISNFDHGPTAHSILVREGIASLFDVTLISADFGRRKPHPSIFAEAVQRLGEDRTATLFVGDTIAEDVRGARAAAIDVVWINRKGEGTPHDEPQPTYTIGCLRELERILVQEPSPRTEV